MRKAVLAVVAIVALIELSGYCPPSYGAAFESTPVPDGVIEGQVANGTAGAPAESVARLEVTLHPFVDDVPQETITAVADAEGRFRFEGLARGPDRTYVVSARYQGVETFSDPLSFATGETTLPALVVVYETTEDDEAIRVERAHIIVDFVEGAMRVGEMLVFRNDGDRTYVGREGQGTLRFSLPPEARGLRFENPRMGTSVIRTKEGFLDTLPVPPGIRQVVLSYDLPYEAGVYRFVKTIEVPTASLDLLVADVGVEVDSDQLVFQGPWEGSGGARYLHFTAQNLARGEELVIQLSNPSAMLRTSLPQQAQGAPEEAGSAGVQEAMGWIGLGLAALSVVFVLSYPRVRRRTEEPLEGKREELLLALARLDDTFEAGEIAEEEYRRRRGEVKAQLIEVMRRQREMNRSQ